eukprot:COSAG03_NODE_28028_length_235_cov_21.367647_1_plen_24_part_01
MSRAEKKDFLRAAIVQNPQNPDSS